MKSVLVLLIVLLISLAVYLGYSVRFAYFNGIICKKIGLDAKAAEMFEKGCNSGNLPSCVDLGIMYENALGVDKNSSKARMFYLKASRHGYKPADIRLGKIAP